MSASKIFLLLLTIYGSQCKNLCGQQSHESIVNGDFGNIRKNAINCTYVLGNRDEKLYSTVTFLDVRLNGDDYFAIHDENGKMINGPFYGELNPFAIVTNKQVTVILVIEHSSHGYVPHFRGYVKTHKVVLEHKEDPASAESIFCGVPQTRAKRQPPTCRNIILRDIFHYVESGELITKIQQWKLIPNDGELTCRNEDCEGKLRLGQSEQDIDKYRWRCRSYVQHGHRKPTQCGYHQSLRRHSFFYKSKLHIWQIVVFVNLWMRKVPLWVIEEQAQMSHPTAVDWSSFCREVVFDAVVKSSTKIGGPGKIVEIDESKFGKRKYNKGHAVDGAWVFGGIERGTGRVFMEVVKDRSAKTLIPLIHKWIEPQTTILSDQWSSYRSLSLQGYTHSTVNHHNNFKDPETGVHTNSIEAIWGHAKENVPKRGRREEFLGGYLARYMVAKRAESLKTDPMLLFFEYARRLYDPMNPTDIESTETEPTAGPSGEQTN